MSAQVAPSAIASDPVRHATALVAIGEVFDAEAVLDRHLEASPGDLTALSLLAKVKHVRGQLSEAVALWTQLHAGGPQATSAAVRLGSMLHLARDPEGGSGEFLALGPSQLWRKPKPFLELEHAFRLFLARKPGEAGAVCEQVAQKYRGKDPDVFKLAVLAQAWVAELSGDLSVARRILEGLGGERGFEGDTDRAVALARVCEQLGTNEDLEKAAFIYEYLARERPRVTIAGNLSAIYRALGRAEEAGRAERRFVEVFRRRMHIPSFEDLTEVAAQHYFPLERLRAAVDETGDVPDRWPERRRAVGLALKGEAARAGALLDAERDPLDAAYLGDLALAEGDRGRARSLYLGALRDGWCDLKIVGWLLEEEGRAPSAEVRERLGGGALSNCASVMLATALNESPLRASCWRHAGILAGLRGDGAELRRCLSRADALAAAAEKASHRIGRVYAAAVYHLPGGAKGLVHEVWADRKPAVPGRGGWLEEVLGSTTPELGQAVRNTFVSVREYALAKLPHLSPDVFDYTYSFKITKEDEPSGGLSGGLPTALAFLSVLIQRPVPRDVAATGVLVSDAHDVLVVKPVGEIEHKVRGACHRGLRMLLVPEGNRRDLEASRNVPRLYSRRVASLVSDLDEAVTRVFGDDVWR